MTHDACAVPRKSSTIKSLIRQLWIEALEIAGKKVNGCFFIVVYWFLLQFYRNGKGLNMKTIFSSEQTQNQIKTILHTNFKLRHVWNAETTLVMTHRKYHWLHDRHLQRIFKVSATSVDASVQTLAKAGDRLNNTPYENLNIFKSA